jgi:hypothetical protein
MALQPLVGPRPLCSFLILYTVGMTPWAGDQPVARPLPIHMTTRLQNKRTQTSMPRVGLEPTTPVFEQAKTIHALDRASAVTGLINTSSPVCAGAILRVWTRCSAVTSQIIRLYSVQLWDYQRIINWEVCERKGRGLFRGTNYPDICLEDLLLVL